jgi:type I restriction enzyme M protein
VGLGPNLFYGSGIPACIVVMNRTKPAERKGKVLFIHGAEELVEGKAQNLPVRPECRPFGGGIPRVGGRGAVLPRRGPRRDRHERLQPEHPSIRGHAEPEEEIDVGDELAALKALIEERDEAEKKMLEKLSEVGYES